MEHESELERSEAIQTDDGYSEKKLAKQVDRRVSSNMSQNKQNAQNVQVFVSPHKQANHTVFQAQKDEEK